MLNKCNIKYYSLISKTKLTIFYLQIYVIKYNFRSIYENYIEKIKMEILIFFGNFILHEISISNWVELFKLSFDENRLSYISYHCVCGWINSRFDLVNWLSYNFGIIIELSNVHIRWARYDRQYSSEISVSGI